ncbi:hypothetical protein IBTHAUMO2_450079 [Nitrosopumilaceae archaeon]|nr:hypothetical protein IBTHAUMO2_450079 [Nitrosopumilaceae archaeon]
MGCWRMILTRMLKIPAISGRAIGGGPGAIRSRADPGLVQGPGDRASDRRIQSIRGAYLVAIPAGPRPGPRGRPVPGV